MIAWLRSHKIETILAILIFLYIGYFASGTVQKHQTLHTAYYDLGIMHQVVYNTYRGRILELSAFDEPITIKRMAIHNDPLLALLAPFYFMYDGPETLLVIQSIMLGLGALGIYKISLFVNRKKLLALVFAFSYLIYPALQRSNIFDFHAVVLATSLLIFMVYFSMVKRYRMATVMFVLALLAKENVALTTGMYGLFLIISEWRKSRKHNRFGWLLFTVSTLWFIASFWFIIPYFRGENHFALDRYSYLGSSPEEVIKNIFLKPKLIYNQLAQQSAYDFIYRLFAPVAFISFLAPHILIITLPEFAINLLSSSMNMRSIGFQYTALLTPFIFISAIYGAQTIISKIKTGSYLSISLAIVIASIYMSYRFGPLVFSQQADAVLLDNITPENTEIYYWRDKLRNEDIFVSTTGNLGAQFSGRKTYHRFSPKYHGADYIIISKDRILNDWYNPEGTKEAYSDIIKHPDYILIYKRGALEVYQKKGTKFDINKL